MSSCTTCHGAIGGRSLIVSDKPYHPECFKCDVCKLAITETVFHETDAGKPLCDKCYTKSCPNCAGCYQPITSGKTINALGRAWHEDHFVCKMCKQSLAGNFHVENEAPVCQSCFSEKIAEKCKGCNKPIDAKSTIALDATWHPECFKCKMCSKPIQSKFKVSPAGFPLCSTC